MGIRRSGGTDGAVTIKLGVRLLEGGATEDEDFRLDSSSLSWKAGGRGTKSFGFSILPDHDGKEGDETFDLVIANFGGAGEGKLTSTQITINDKPPAPKTGKVNFEKSAWENREDGSSINIRAIRSGGSDGITEFDYSVGGRGDTATLNEDYTPENESGKLTWKDGEDGLKSFSIKVVADNDGNEGNETVSLSLTSVFGASVGNTPTATLFIIDAPTASGGFIQFAKSSYEFAESDGDVKLVLQRIDGSAGVAEAFISYGGSGDSAAKGEDHIDGTASVCWADGDSSDKTISVPQKTDTITEQDESFSVFIDDISGAEPGNPGSATVTIKNSTVRANPASTALRIRRTPVPKMPATSSLTYCALAEVTGLYLFVI